MGAGDSPAQPAYRMPTHPDPSNQFLYLTTRGRKTAQPREIEIWFTHRGGHYYVIAEYPTSQWVQNLKANPQVQVRVGQETFVARARVLSPDTDCDQLNVVQELSRKKYGWGDGQVVELSPQ